jgi:hypothetical protein
MDFDDVTSAWWILLNARRRCGIVSGMRVESMNQDVLAHAEGMRRLAAALSHDSALAEDAVQDPRIAANVSVRLRLRERAAQGFVDRVEIAAGEKSLTSSSIESCVLDVVSGVPFPPPRKADEWVEDAFGIWADAESQD